MCTPAGPSKGGREGGGFAEENKGPPSRTGSFGKVAARASKAGAGGGGVMASGGEVADDDDATSRFGTVARRWWWKIVATSIRQGKIQ